MIFFETCWANSSGGFEGPETFFGFVHALFISPLFHLSSFSSHLFSSLLFHPLSLHLVSSFISDLLLLLLWSLLSSSVLSLLLHVVSSFISSHVLLLLLSFLVSPLTCLFTCLASFLVLCSLFFSCLVSSLFLCLSLSLSVSLCLSLFLSVSLCFCLSLSVSLCLCCVVCVVSPCVCSKTPPCVRSKRLRVKIQNVPVCTGTTPACVTTCGRGAGTHGDVLNAHTGGRGEEGAGVVLVNFLLSKSCPRRVITCFRGSPQETFASYPFKV